MGILGGQKEARANHSSTSHFFTFGDLRSHPGQRTLLRSWLS